MRVREIWPTLAGAAAGLLILMTTFAGSLEAERLLGIGLRGWLWAVLAFSIGLGGQLFVNARSSLIRERRLVHAAASMRELTAQLEFLATTDTLTGIYNRRVFFERLGVEYRRAMRYGRPLSVIMVDLDHFKRVNDRCGHPFGDLVLTVAAQTIRSNVRESDLVARYGGEEFVLMLPETAQREAMVVGEKLRRTIAEQEFTDGILSIRMTISLGVASLPQCAPSSAEDLIRLADEALYAAKRAGRDRAVAATPAIAPD